jgi:hypothetical protein
MVLELPESESEFLGVKEESVVQSGKLDAVSFSMRPIMT